MSRNSSCQSIVSDSTVSDSIVSGDTIGIIAGNGSFPISFARNAKDAGYRVVAVCHKSETDPEIEQIADLVEWIKVGQLGRMISVFKEQGVSRVAMAGGISRVRTFRDVHLDARGAMLLARIRSTKDDTIMRGIAEEIEREGIVVVACTMFSGEFMVQEGCLTSRKLTTAEQNDIDVGVAAIASMSEQHIGQLVVVKDGVIVAVEAVEGSDAAILRGGELGGLETVVVKYAKPSQDMRFDVPTVGATTIHTMIESGAKVLALEAGRSLIMDREDTIALANKHKIAIIGCPALVAPSCDS